MISTLAAAPRFAGKSLTLQYPVSPAEKAENRSTDRPFESLSGFSGQTLQLYFGKTDRTNLSSQAPLIQRAVDWYDANIEKIPPLLRGGNRSHHRVHLRMMGDVLGLLPPVDTAAKAYYQYVDTFNALEVKAAPEKGALRMSCHDRQALPAADRYILRQHGYYILVFAPNGAIESFRRQTPPEVDIDGQNQTDYKLRVQLFSATQVDFERLQTRLAENNNQLSGVPDFLAGYTRSVFKPGADGKDAWNRPFTFPAELQQARQAFQLTETSKD